MHRETQKSSFYKIKIRWVMEGIGWAGMISSLIFQQLVPNHIPNLKLEKKIKVPWMQITVEKD